MIMQGPYQYGKIKSEFNNNHVDGGNIKDPFIYAVENATVLDEGGKQVFKGDLFIANLNGYKISKKSDH